MIVTSGSLNSERKLYQMWNQIEAQSQNRNDEREKWAMKTMKQSNPSKSGIFYSWNEARRRVGKNDPGSVASFDAVMRHQWSGAA
jgi:hypothetical protein